MQTMHNQHVWSQGQGNWPIEENHPHGVRRGARLCIRDPGDLMIHMPEAQLVDFERFVIRAPRKMTENTKLVVLVCPRPH